MISEKFLDWVLRDLNKLKDEISLYKNENDLWSSSRDIKNPAGTLAFHIIGNLKHFIGAQLGNTGYIRTRDKEFSEKNIQKKILLQEIEEVIVMIKKILPAINDEMFHSEYPIEFLGQKRITGEVLLILYGHLNYHLGQINYYRRLLP